MSQAEASLEQIPDQILLQKLELLDTNTIKTFKPVTRGL